MFDESLALLRHGYAWLPDLTRRQEPGPVRTRLLGRPAVALRGPEAVEFFYDEDHVRRRTALPEPVLSTLFGKGAVHTLDGPEHRTRKELFVGLLTNRAAVQDLVEHVTVEWERALGEWRSRPRVQLFDEVALLLTRAVCTWSGAPLADQPERDVRELARDVLAMVDGFATPGPRHWRARRARNRQEERLAALVEELRRRALTETAPAVQATSPGPGTAAVPAPSRTSAHEVVRAVAAHCDADGVPLDARTAAVEILNIVRPAVAIAWYTVFGAHALHRHPELRLPLAYDRAGYGRAFAHEVRRFYPFAPFVAGLAPRWLEWRGEPIPEGALVLLDLYGQNHDPQLWESPYVFDPERFVGREPGRNELVPQGGGEPATGHRCPGEDITVAVLATLLPRLARIDYDVPAQDLRIPLSRIPTRPRSGFVMAHVR